MSGNRTKKLRALFASELEKVPEKERKTRFRRIKKMWNNLNVHEKKQVANIESEVSYD